MHCVWEGKEEEMNDLQDDINTCCVDGCSKIGKWKKGIKSWDFFVCDSHSKNIF
jgi:hypothetical protein